MRKILLSALILSLLNSTAVFANSTTLNWSTDDYTEAMINGGDADDDPGNNWWFANVYMRTVTENEGTSDEATYTYFYVRLTDEQIFEIQNNSGSVKNQIYFSQGGGNAAIIESGDPNFHYITDASGNIIGFEAKIDVSKLNIPDPNFDYTSNSYYGSFDVQASVNWDTNNDGTFDDLGNTATNKCRASDGTCNGPVCLTDNCSPGGGLEPGIPVDGGLSILAFFGIAFGVYNQRKK